jgi:sugar lactone lactonase YvrE
MRTRRTNTVVLAALLLLGLLATGAPAWSQGRRSDVVRERLKTRPDDPTLHYYLAVLAIGEGDKAGGIAALRDVARLGTGFLPPEGIGFEPVRNDTAFLRVRGDLERALPVVTSARELFRLDKNLIPEGIAYDPARRSYFVGSIAQSKIVRVDSTGAVTDLSRPGELRHVLGLVVDAGRRRLPAVSTSAIVPRPGVAPVNEIVTYDVDMGSRLRAVPVPAAGQLNDVVVSSGGDLYTTDSQGGAVYRVRADGAVVDTFVAPGTLPGANGLAVSTDGVALYVAHSTGVARVELSGGAVLGRIEIPKGESIGAIDGLYADGTTLVGIQNVTNPGRVVRIHLRADGKGTERIETLLSHHHPAIAEPTTGVVVGRTFALLATTQVGRFTPEGKIDRPETVRPPVVLAVDLEPVRR